MSGLFEAFERIQLSSHNRMGIDIDTEGWAMDGSSGFFVAEHKQTLVFDADQDGDMDVLWVTGARTMYTNSGPQQEKQPNFLLKNNGTGWFYTPDEEELVWPGTLGTSSAAVAGDFDGDGSIDVFIVNSKEQNQLVLNDGNGKIFSASTNAGDATALSRDSRDVVAGDFAGDGDLDLFVVNMKEVNELFLNDGSGHFTAVYEGDAVESNGMSNRVVAA